MAALRVILEVGPKRRVVAGATDWPGLERAAASEEAALEKLLAYHPRYTAVAARAGMTDAFAAATEIEVVERTPGSSSTDFWASPTCRRCSSSSPWPTRSSSAG